MGLVSHLMVTFIQSAFQVIVASVLTGQYVGIILQKLMLVGTELCHIS